MKIIWAKDIVEEDTGLRYSGVAEVINGEWHIVVNLSMGLWIIRPFTMIHELLHVLMDECRIPWIFHVIHDLFYCLFWPRLWYRIPVFLEQRIDYYRKFNEPTR